MGLGGGFEETGPEGSGIGFLELALDCSRCVKFGAFLNVIINNPQQK